MVTGKAVSKICEICGATKVIQGIVHPRLRCPDCRNTYSRIWKRKNGHKRATGEALIRVRAREYSKAYIRRGKLIKGPCEVCGTLDVEQHHDDYSKPLAVRWLCKKHHMELHKSLSHGSSVDIPLKNEGVKP